MVKALVEAGVGGAIGAFVVNEIVQAIDYTGAGSGLLDLLAFIVIAVAIIAMLDDAEM